MSQFSAAHEREKELIASFAAHADGHSLISTAQQSCRQAEHEAACLPGLQLPCLLEDQITESNLQDGLYSGTAPHASDGTQRHAHTAPAPVQPGSLYP